jgi:hypothetical protein
MRASVGFFFAKGRASAAAHAYRAGLRAGRSGQINATATSNLFAKEFRAGLVAGFRGGILAARRRQEAA